MVSSAVYHSNYEQAYSVVELKLCNHMITVQLCLSYAIKGLQCRCAQIIQSYVYSVGVLKLYNHRFTV